MYEFGDVLLAEVPFTDNNETKKRSAVGLFQESSNIIIGRMTSNLNRSLISVTKSEGAVKDNIIKAAYISTLSNGMTIRKLFSLNENKKQILREEIHNKIY